MTAPRTVSSTFVAYILFLAPLNSFAANTALTLVGGIATAARTLDYEGDFAYIRDNDVDTMHIVHQVQNGSEAERVISLSGAAREMVRTGKHTTCTFTDDKSMMTARREPRDFVEVPLSQPLEQVSQHYAIMDTGSDRVAGRPVFVVSIKSRHPDRYSYHLWIDKATNLLLKSTVQGDTGSPVEQVIFTRIKIGEPIASDALQPELKDTGYKSLTSSEQVATDGPPLSKDVSVNWLPPGFAMRASANQQIESMPRPVRHWAFTDGLAAVSVFVEKMLDNLAPMQGSASLGAVHAFSRVDNNFQITVVGEVPQATVHRIATSVSFDNPK